MQLRPDPLRTDQAKAARVGSSQCALAPLDSGLTKSGTILPELAYRELSNL